MVFLVTVSLRWLMMMMAATYRSPTCDSFLLFCFEFSTWCLCVAHARAHRATIQCAQWLFVSIVVFSWCGARARVVFLLCKSLFFVYLWFLSNCKSSKWPAHTHTRARVFIGFLFAFHSFTCGNRKWFFILITYTFYSMNAFNVHTNSNRRGRAEYETANNQ